MKIDMTESNFLAKVIHFSPDHFTITLQVCFTEEKDFNTILDVVNSKHILSFKVKDRAKKHNPATDKQIRFWYACVRNILKFYDVDVDSENMKTLHLQLKKKYLPVTYINVGLVQLPLIPSLTEIALTDMREGLDNLIEDYLKLGLDLKKYSLS
jgi:hypothetical protein